MAELVVTKIAERGNKYEESGQCIASHDYSIVFLPRGVKPGELVRVRLVAIRDAEGNERKDSRGAIMYRAEWALPKVSGRFRKAIAEEARALRSCRALPQHEGETVLRVQFGSLPTECTGFGWYYFGDEHVVYGSRFSPSALLLFEAIEKASESGVCELLAWLVDERYFALKQAGQGVDRSEVPVISDEAIEKLHTAPGAILARQLA